MYTCIKKIFIKKNGLMKTLNNLSVFFVGKKNSLYKYYIVFILGIYSKNDEKSKFFYENLLIAKFQKPIYQSNYRKMFTFF